VLRRLALVADQATRDLEGYDYARALQRSEEFFWRFCDDYLELVKGRRYGEQGPEAAASANSALVAALSVVTRLFAPFLPFVTEEIWSWWKDGSIHAAAWPSRLELESVADDNSAETRRIDERAYDWATGILAEVRKNRSEAKQPLRVPISRVFVRADAETAALLPLVEADLKTALRVRTFEVAQSGHPGIDVEGYEQAP
jgi:valyl-tRNA synthetase